MKELTAQYLAEFCSELALLVRSGVSPSDGLELMRDDDDDRSSRALLSALVTLMETQPPLSSALAASGRFPEYFVSAIRLGERTGRVDDTLASLSTYYERRAWFEENLRKAVSYPLLLLVLMAVVVVVLITKVLPIFENVFDQVGAQMSATATALMRFGSWLSSASAVLLSILAVFAVGLVLVYNVPALRATFARAWMKRRGDRGIGRSIATSRFAMAMSMAVSAGLGTEEALSLAGELAGERSRAERCQSFVDQGESLEESLLHAGVFSRRDSRLLALGTKTGNADAVMSRIAERSENEAVAALDDRLRRIEPTLVIVLSVIVGLILFSVMLPLMGIMSSLG